MAPMMSGRPWCVAVTLLAAVALAVTADATAAVSPRFSWDTLPVFFHSSNTSGPWSDAAAQQIARFAMATNEKSHAMKLPGGGTQSEEIAGPAACRQVDKASNGSTNTFFYLNSVIDWPFNYKLHAAMQANPSWRVKHPNGSDFRITGNNWAYNLSNPECRAAWIAECVAATTAGCTGCFIDQANDKEPFVGNTPAGRAYSAAHLATLVELSQTLASTGKYAIMNHLGDLGDHVHAMMVEDFAGSEKCIRLLQTLAARGFAVEAHAGDLPLGENYCVNGDTNSMAAFLIGAGDHHYYHCAGQPSAWGSNPRWPAVKDAWLDWLPEYDYNLGLPKGPAASRPSGTGGNTSVWSREFASGTRVEFDGARGNGTIWWADGPVQAGKPVTDPSVAERGCRWEDTVAL